MYCCCGCGGVTPIAERTRRSRGVVKGQPLRYLHGHQTTLPRRSSPKSSVADRFWSKVNKDGPVIYPHLTPCWIWTGALSPEGYGRLSLSRRRDDGKAIAVPEHAHRLAWILVNGPVPDDLHVLHKCDNPPCVNPSHLFTGTNRDNVRDRIAKGRFRTRKAWPQSE